MTCCFKAEYASFVIFNSYFKSCQDESSDWRSGTSTGLKVDVDKSVMGLIMDNGDSTTGLDIGDGESDKEFKVGSKSWVGKGLTKVLEGTSSARVMKACKAEYSNPPD